MLPLQHSKERGHTARRYCPHPVECGGGACPCVDYAAQPPDFDGLSYMHMDWSRQRRGVMLPLEQAPDMYAKLCRQAVSLEGYEAAAQTALGWTSLQVLVWPTLQHLISTP
jgi:hypothetical protein